MTYDRREGECFAKDCDLGAKPRMLMCWSHWKRVPRIVQDAIWTSNYLAHPDHEGSRMAARASLAAKEGLPLTHGEAQALAAYGLGPDGHPCRDQEAG